MAKPTYTNLKLKTNTDVKTIEFNGIKIDILQYLPISDKYSLLNITLGQAMDTKVFNPLKKDMYFHLNLVFMYSNITFTEKQKEDYVKLYDAIQSSGLLDMILENIPEEEYQYLYGYLEELEEKYINYDSTLKSFLESLLSNIPEQIENLQQLISQFDMDKLKELNKFTRTIEVNKENE